MGRQKSTQHALDPRYVFAGIVVAAAITGSLALAIHDDHDQNEDQWAQCFDNGLESALSVGDDLEDALAVVRTERADEQRRLEAHQRALRQLSTDSRWQVPDQGRWLKSAQDQTQAEIDTLQSAIEVAEDTEGCLEQY